jgi:hypothetical protein
MMSWALVKFASEAALAVVRVAIVGVSARPITITTNAAMTTPPVTCPDPAFLANLMTKGCIDGDKYKINLNNWDDYSMAAIVLYISQIMRIG